VLHNGVRAISELITVPGLINLDFADVRTIIRDSGRALMGIGLAEGERRAVRAAQEAIVCPLLEKSSIDGAVGVIVNVKGGSDMGMREVLEAVTTVQKAAHPTANIIFGAVVDDEPRPDMQVTVIAAGFPYEALAQAHEAQETVSLIIEAVDAPTPKRVCEREVAGIAPDRTGQYFFVTEEDECEEPRIERELPESVLQFPSQEQKEIEEDMGIPAFMRKRMKRR
jgi:cell division protein FtsZ